MRIWILLAAVVLLSCAEAGKGRRGGNGKGKKGLGRYQCGTNKVLYLYDHEMPYAIHMQCGTPKVCGEEISCTEGACTQTGLNFLKHIHEHKKYDGIDKGCCEYGPEPDDYEDVTCMTFEITDKKKSKRVKALDDEAEQFLQEMGEEQEVAEAEARRKRSVEESLVLEAVTRFKRAASFREGKAQVYKHKITHYVEPTLIVNDINRINKGYEVSLCKIQCKEETTTTEQPTSTQTVKKEDVQYEDNGEGPDQLPKDPTEDEGPSDVAPPEAPEAPEHAYPPEAKPLEFDVNVPGVGPTGLHCFSGDTQVQTPNGPKRMDELTNNDQVLVSDSLYQPIDLWYHRLSDRRIEFVSISTESSKLSISPGHLLPLVGCDEAAALDADELATLVHRQSRFASRAQEGQCVIALRDGRLVPERITRVERETKTGIYSPITEQGSLLVNNVHVSCFSTFENHRAQQTLHSIVMKLYKLFGLSSQAGAVDIPTPIELVKGLGNLILPESMF